MAIAFQKTKYDHLACSPSSPLSFSHTAKITLVQLNTTAKHILCMSLQMQGYLLADLMIIKSRSIAVYAQ